MTIVYVTLGLLLLGLMIANFIFYNKNTRLMLHRNNIEVGILKRIKTFANMCNNIEGEMLDTDASGFTEEAVDDTFVNAMVKVVPYVNANQDQELTMALLAEVAQMDLNAFYEVISANIYKSPRMVARKLFEIQATETD